jgi:hypothetical protein
MDLIYSFAAYTESWIEVSSRPSSSSLSSVGEEVVTTGLRVAQEPGQRRRRRLVRSATTQLQGRIPLRPANTNESSQEEYDESESESDRIMTSSNEDVQPRFLVEEGESPLTEPKSIASDTFSIRSDDDDDENATALGPIDPSPAFTPQPNAFSHPPSSRLSRRIPNAQDSYFPAVSEAASRVPSSSNTTSAPSTIRAHQRTRSHTPYNVIAPNHSVSVDHDAALRASLSTLLSCAAAARGLNKRENTQSGPSRTTARVRASSRVEQGTLRLVPESALNQVESPKMVQKEAEVPSSPSSGPTKRKSKSPSRDRRKKQRGVFGTSDELMNVSPTLTTWVVGAGVLVLFSAISFSAGYALGKEVGRVDAMGSGAAGIGCGKEVDGGISQSIVRGRGWRWGNASGVRA